MTRRRPYRLGKRAQAAAGTRRRIVEATMSLHDEQGITRTSVRDVAGRAGVSPATVLHHFPRMADLIQACGALTDELLPMPTAAVIAEAATTHDALRLTALALFRWWEAFGPGWDHLQVDRRTLTDVDTWLDDVDARHRGLIATALGEDPDSTRVALATALTSRGSWIALRSAGLTPERAAVEVARIFGAAGPAPASVTAGSHPKSGVH